MYIMFVWVCGVNTGTHTHMQTARKNISESVSQTANTFICLSNTHNTLYILRISVTSHPSYTCDVLIPGVGLHGTRPDDSMLVLKMTSSDTGRRGDEWDYVA